LRLSERTAPETTFPPARWSALRQNPFCWPSQSQKSGDEAKILKTYQNAGGRSRLTTYVIGNTTPSVARQFASALHVLHYWRDDASHGVHTTISEVEAQAAISELIRLAQFASDHWADLTT
jgi:hypothetical protein